ncbi:MAG: shikimate kinase [bacterium]|nr:shikimate kinase [bacterium]
MANLYLIGMRGVGKSTVGKLLAHELGRSFVDMDEQIALKAGKSISRLVQEEGWDAFRKLEKEEVQFISSWDNLVVSTGGGVLMFFDNLKQLKQTGTLILLTAKLETVVQRLAESENRPSLKGKDYLEELEEVWAERRETYEKAANVIIDTEDKTPEEIVKSIIPKP